MVVSSAMRVIMKAFGIGSDRSDLVLTNRKGSAQSVHLLPHGSDNVIDLGAGVSVDGCGRFRRGGGGSESVSGGGERECGGWVG